MCHLVRSLTPFKYLAPAGCHGHAEKGELFVGLFAYRTCPHEALVRNCVAMWFGDWFYRVLPPCVGMAPRFVFRWLILRTG